MKTVIFVHQHFRTPEEGGGVRSYFLAEALSNSGLNVLVIRGLVPKSQSEIRISKNFLVKGIDVPYSQSFSSRQRISAFFAFARKATGFIKRMNPKPELAYIISTPLSVGLVGIYLKRFLKIPFVFEVGDLWPEVPIQMGILRNPLMKSFSKWLERSSYNNAELISSLSPGITESIKETAPGKEILTIPNFSDNGFFNVSRKSSQLAKDEFTLGYFGAAGKANGLSFLTEIVKRSQETSPKVRFVFMMEGSEMNHFKEEVQSFPNVHFHDFSNREGLRERLKEIDIGIVSFSDFQILGTGSPNKLFDYLASGKMVICNSKGWFQEIIEREQAGLYIPFNNPEILFEKLKGLSDENLFTKMCSNATRLAESEFDKNKLVNTWREKILSLEALKD